MYGKCHFLADQGHKSSYIQTKYICHSKMKVFLTLWSLLASGGPLTDWQWLHVCMNVWLCMMTFMRTKNHWRNRGAGVPNTIKREKPERISLPKIIIWSHWSYLLAQTAISCSAGMLHHFSSSSFWPGLDVLHFGITWCTPCWCRRTPWTGPGWAPPSAPSPSASAWPAPLWTQCRSSSHPSGFSAKVRVEIQMRSWTHQLWLVRRSNLLRLESGKVNWPGIDKSRKLGKGGDKTGRISREQWRSSLNKNEKCIKSILQNFAALVATHQTHVSSIYIRILVYIY